MNLTVDEMKIVITADSSDIDKKIKDINNLFKDFKIRFNTSFTDKKAFSKELQLIDKTNERKINFQNEFGNSGQQIAQKQALAIEQMNERFEQRQRLIKDKSLNYLQKQEERHGLMVQQLAERNLLRREFFEQTNTYNKQKLDQVTSAQQQRLLESNALKEQETADRVRKQKEDMYEKLFFQIRESEKKQASQEQQIAEKMHQKKQEMYEKLFNKQVELDQKKALKQNQLAEKNAQRELELAERKSQRELELAERNAQKQRQLTEKNALKQQNSTSSIMTDLGKKVAGVFAGLQIGKVLFNSIKDSVNAVEYESLFQVSFGKMADGVRSWSNEVSQALGLNGTEIRKTTSVMYDMIKALNVGEKSALTMAKGVTLLSKDVASFRHADPQLVYDRISAGLMGNTRGLHLMGYAITESTVKNFAYQKGIAQVGTELSEQQKVISRYLLLMEQTKTAHGNLAQTLNSPANQIRMMTANLKYLSETIGNLFMPLLNAVIPILNAFTILLTRAVTAIKDFFGVKSNVDYAKEMHAGLLNATTDLGDMNKGAEDFNKNLKKTDNGIKKVQKSLAKFDEMNVLMDKTKTPKTVIDKNALKMQNMWNAFDFPIEEYNPHIEWIKDNVKRMVDEIQNSFNNMNFEPLKNSLKILQDALKPLYEEISQNLQWFYNNVLLPISKWTIEALLPASIDLLTASVKFLATASELGRPALIWFYDNFLVPLSKLVGFAVIELIKLLTKALTGLSDWANNHKEEMNLAFKYILSFLAGIMIYDKSQPIVDFVKKFTTALSDGSGGVTSFSDACKKGLTNVDKWFKTIGAAAVSTFVLQAGIGFLVMAITDLVKNWDIMNGMERVTAVFGAIASAVLLAAVAFGAFHTAATMGLAAIGIATGIGLVYASIVKAKDRAMKEFTSGNIKLPAIVQPDLKFPKVAKGGIVKHRTFAEIGENGAEAVVPLEKNTGWIDMLASKLGGSNQPINLTVKIGEDSIINRVIDGINNKTMEMGRGMVMM